MKIGTLAKAVGCHVETVRYYEKKGLLPASTKAANNYGEYSETHLKFLRLIRHAKSLGFSQPQIRELVHLATNKEDACNKVQQLTLKNLDAISSKMSDLQKMQKALRLMSEACEKNLHRDCPVLEHLISET